MHRNRLIYGLLTISTLLVGLASRRFLGGISFIRTYMGDVLWALTVFFGFAFVFNRWPTKAIALAAILFSFGVEITQLYHSPWIDNLRATRLGGLIMGFSFGWSDLLCYSLGIALGVLFETCFVLTPFHFKNSRFLK